MALALSVDGEQKDRLKLPPGRHIVGRNPASCVVLDELWISRVQATIDVFPMGWVVTNGYRTRMRAESTQLSAEVRQGGSTWVPAGGDMRLWWPELRHELLLHVEPGRTGDRLPKPFTGRAAPIIARQQTRASFDRRRKGDALQHHLRAYIRNGPLSESDTDKGDQLSEENEVLFQRERLAVLFRHEILGTPRPTKLYQTAAAALGVSEASLKQLVSRTLSRLNRGRPIQLIGVDSLGHYLVHTSSQLSADDLPDRCT